MTRPKTQERIIRSAYGPRHRLRLTITEPSLAKQSFKKECDINNIMARYQKTGIVDHVAKHEARYGETSPATYHESMVIIANARSMFEELPSKARKYFNNDPAAFLAFTENYDPEKDKSMLTDLGLAHGTPPDPVPTLPGNPDNPSSGPAPDDPQDPE